MTTEQILKAEFESIRKDVIAGMGAKGMNASGDSAKSLEVAISGEGGGKSVAKLIGNKNFEQLEFGRRKGKMPPVQAIKKWIEDKGIVSNTSKKISVTSLAWAIAKKIGKKGWDRKGFGGVELISEIITPERMQTIIDKVGAELAITFSKTLATELKKIAA